MESDMKTFPVLEVKGSAIEMGRQHGREAAPLIHRYLKWIERLTGKSRGELCANALRFAPYIQKLSPRYLEEVKGLAEGARIGFAEAMLCQARAEASRTWDGACTAFALTRSATAGGRPLAGQNQDLEPEYAEVAVVLRVQPSDGRPRATMLTFAGQLGYAGMNEHGVCNFVNALYGYRWRPGLPYYPLRRAILEQKSVADCVALLRRFRACSAVNLVMADGGGAIADVECRPEGVEVFHDEHPDARLHTNHYLAAPFLRFEDNTLPDSVPRLSRMREMVRRSWGTITAEALRQMLGDHDGSPAGICRHGSVSMDSVAGYIAEPAAGRFHVRRGHGCDGTWSTYSV
jgi:isopenicillin-N N-acyltransferase like protein